MSKKYYAGRLDILVKSFANMSKSFLLLELSKDKPDKAENYKVVGVNPAFEKLAQTKKSDAVGKSAGEIWPGPGIEWVKIIDGVIKNGGSIEFETGSHESGNYYKIEAFRPQEELLAVMIENISHQKNVTEQIRFQAFLLENINCAIGATDYKGNYIYWNKHMEKLFQWKKEEILGKNLVDIRLNEDMKAGDKKLFEQLQTSGYMEFEAMCPRKDKTAFPAHVIVASLKDKNGDITALVGIHTDITEQKKLEAELRESRERWRFALEGSGDGVWDWNIVTNEVFYSDFWKSLVEVRKTDDRRDITNWLDRVHPEDRAMVEAGLENHIKGGTPHFSCEHRIRCANKIYKWFLGRGKITETSPDGKPARMIGTLSDISDRKSMENEVHFAKKMLLDKNTFHDIVGRSAQMKKIMNILPTVARSDCNVLIEGPSGTGKSLVARAIHELSPRRESPFHIINCGSLPETLLESELFGYAKGAFTDAKKDKPGKFETAGGGVILLDEIGDMPLSTQVKILNFIENKTYEPLGGNIVKKSDIRLIASTNRDIDGLLKKKLFREDLYYRLKIVSIKIPPLNKRLDDIELLTERFMDDFNRKYARNVIKIERELNKFLLAYDYPGNARELYNMLEHAYIFCNGPVLKMDHLPEEYRAKTRPVKGFKKTGKVRLIDAIKDSSEIKTLVDALKKNDYNRNRTSEHLGVNRVQLWRLMKKHGLL